jgi:hypothetical protein
MVKGYNNIAIPAQAGIRPAAQAALYAAREACMANPRFINALRADQTPAFAGVAARGGSMHV